MKAAIVILSLMTLTACQASEKSNAGAEKPDVFVEARATLVPAADDRENLDYTVLPDGFPIVAEMDFNVVPSQCHLFRPESGGKADEKGMFRYVLTSELGSLAEDNLFQIAMNGKIRTLKQTYAMDSGPKKTRYLQTFDDDPLVEMLVELETLETPIGDVHHKGLIGRIKAWDEEIPLLCGYNRIRVEGDCDL